MRPWKYAFNLGKRGLKLVTGPFPYCDDSEIYFPHSDGIRPVLKYFRAYYPHYEFKSEKDGYGGWHILERRLA